MRILLSISFVFLGLQLMTAQPVQITFEVSNYEQDEVMIGYYYGDKQYVLDTLSQTEKGKYKLERDTLLKGGAYLLIFKPDLTYMEFLVNKVEDQVFTLKVDATNPSKPTFESSDDNSKFYDYLIFLDTQRKRNEALQKEKDSLATLMQPIEELEKEMLQINEEVLAYQQSLVNNYPEYISAKLIKSNFQINIPEYEGDEKEVKLKRYRYYKDHYFDNVDLGDPDMLRTPVINQRINYYLESLTLQTPDSIVKSVDYLLENLEPAEESFRFYLANFINKYAKSKIVGFDAVYVHIALNYYGKGKAPWIDDENLEEILENARALEPILVGKQAPPLMVYKRDGSPVELYDIDSEYTVLLFWASDCGHCKKSMPDIISFYQKWKDRGVEILAVCTKHRNEAENCWKFIDEREGMENWINANDPFHKSGFRFKYKVETTPKIFVMDKDKKIIVKRIGTEQLDEVFEELFKKAEEKILQDR